MIYYGERKRRIKKLIAHRKAFKAVEKAVLGKNTFRCLTHDLDKLFKYIFFLSVKRARVTHKRKARHHNPLSTKDFIESIVDWEASRFTKPECSLTAYEYYLHKQKLLSVREKRLYLKHLGELGLSHKRTSLQIVLDHFYKKGVLPCQRK